MQFLDSITFPYDDATRRHVLTLFQHKVNALGPLVDSHRAATRKWISARFRAFPRNDQSPRGKGRSMAALMAEK
ncbi:unnamed protein product [Heligmosomoides polygyrus]|uniref:Transposase n=1 Tax=Heligmosomoides polygyrus TaxID=6339 RepID=A0A183F2G6_HELPZ|nr:unnamed protein product [Heligmosomoides polygyrus]